MPSDKTSKSRSAAAEAKQDRRILPERRAAKERRSGAERRKEDQPVAIERRNGKERRVQEKGERRKVERRINEYPLKDEVLEFINAINEFKSVNQKPFPTWSEIHEIFLGLGYRKPE
jgi:hypothetical protein